MKYTDQQRVEKMLAVTEKLLDYLFDVLPGFCQDLKSLL